MNFEVLDNVAQVCVLGVCALVSFVLAVRGGVRRYLSLTFAYVCFLMGTLFYVLHLAITGNVPQIFYVSEISWIAAYLFILSLQIERSQGLRLHFFLPGVLTSALALLIILYFRILGPSWFVSLLFGATAAVTIYLTACRRQAKLPGRRLDICVMALIFWQILLYCTSAFVRDYSHFNLYFAVDLMVTASLVAMLPLNLQEVRRS